MKYIKGYLLLGLTLILGSCSDFLDRDPDQILTNDQIFSDAKMINSVLAGFMEIQRIGDKVLPLPPALLKWTTVA